MNKFLLIVAFFYSVTQVGAPPEIACLLDDIRLENGARKRNATASTCLGVDPELDEFMVRFSITLNFPSLDYTSRTHRNSST